MLEWRVGRRDTGTGPQGVPTADNNSNNRTNNNSNSGNGSRLNMFESIIDKFHRSRRKADLNTVIAKDVTAVSYGSTANDVCTTGNSSTAISTVSTKKTGLAVGGTGAKVASAKATARWRAFTENPSLGFTTGIGGASVNTTDLCVADSMGDVEVEKICRLPERFDRNEWLATHILALFDHVNALCGTVSEACTPVTCHVMNYPGSSKVSWVDEKGKRHNYSAMRYIDSVMSYCEASRNNQQLFPTKYGSSFGPNFDAQVRRMIRLLWHCCGHLYHRHWELLCSLNLRAQYALVITHLSTVSRLFSLLDAKEMSSIQITLQIVRPPLPPEPIFETSTTTDSKQRPTKRLNSGYSDEFERPAARFSEPTGSAARTADGPLAHLFASQFAQIPLGQKPLFSENQAEQMARWTAKICRQYQFRADDSRHQQSSGFALPSVMKSGSWGGNSAPAVLSASADTSGDSINNVNTTRSFKNFVQTY